MSITKAIGTGVDIASAYGASKTMSAISNASQAVATLEAAHGFIVGDYAEVTSGWGKLNGRIVRVVNVATNDVTFEDINTSSTTDYPAGTGAGSVREVTSWAEITQRTPNLSQTFGQVTFADISDLKDTEERKMPIRRAASEMSIPGYYDPSLSWVSTVRTASDTSVATGLRVRYPDGSVMVANAYWSMADGAAIEDFTLRDEITVTFAAKAITYAT